MRLRQVSSFPARRKQAGVAHHLEVLVRDVTNQPTDERQNRQGLIDSCVARGSASELEYQLLLARDLKLIQSGDHEQLERQTTEIKRMLTVFVQKLTAES